MMELVKPKDYCEAGESICLIVELEIGKKIVEFFMSKASKTKEF